MFKLFQFAGKPLIVLCFYSTLLLCIGCSSNKRVHSTVDSRAASSVFLEDLLKKHPEYFNTILNNRDSLRVQVIYSQIDRNPNNKPFFTHYYFNVDRGKYFYPASVVKMPIAVLALEKLRNIKKYGIDRNKTMITEAAYPGKPGYIMILPRQMENRPWPII